MYMHMLDTCKLPLLSGVRKQWHIIIIVLLIMWVRDLVGWNIDGVTKGGVGVARIKVKTNSNQMKFKSDPWDSQQMSYNVGNSSHRSVISPHYIRYRDHNSSVWTEHICIAGGTSS